MSSTPPLRIALLGSSQWAIRQPFAGGLEAHVWRLAGALTALGHSVSLFAAEGSMVAGTESLTVRPLQLSDAARADPTAPESMVHEHHAYLSMLLDLAGPAADDFDVVHNHSLHYLPIALSRLIPVPMLTTLHTPPIPWLESAAALSTGLAYAAVSRFTARQWTSLAGSITVVPNGVPTDVWTPGPGGEYAVWSGRLVPEKGLPLAVEAARRAGVPLRIAGPQSDRSYFTDVVRPLLGRDVTYEGHLGQDELVDLVGGAAVALVTPVWDEPYGLVVAEALACGTPVAAFARGGIPEIVDDSCGRLAPADDVDALVRLLPEAAALSRRAARRRAEESCSEQRMVEAYLELYATLRQRDEQGSAA